MIRIEKHTPLSSSSAAVAFIRKHCQSSGNEFLEALLAVLEIYDVHIYNKPQMRVQVL